MWSRADIVSFGFALVAHGTIAVALASVRVEERPQNRVVEFDVQPLKKPPVVVPTPEPEKPPEPPPKVKKVDVPQFRPAPNQTPPKTPPKEPPPPQFGVTMSSTTEDSTFSVPVGNTTMIDPSKSVKSDNPSALPAAPVAPAPPAYQPVSELFIKRMPDIDGQACAKLANYTPEAEQLGIEGEVHLRIALNEKGGVHEIKVLKGLGHGLDQVALNALKHKCRFTPAIANDGKAVPYVIPKYVFTFELPR